jgi:hypothetical protein
MMAQKKKGGLGGFILLIALILIALAATNPDREQFRDVMRQQKKFMTTAASFLPMKRTNYVIASRFDIEYGIGKVTCWGAAYTVFICPDDKKPAKPGKFPASDEAQSTGAE